MIVTDASVILEVLLRTAAGDTITERILDQGETLHAPHLLDIEVAQVLRRYVARGDMSAARGGEALLLLAEFPVARHSHQPLLDRIWQLRDNLTAYDAAYVALAEGLRAVLLTRDARLASAPGVAAIMEVV